MYIKAAFPTSHVDTPLNRIGVSFSHGLLSVFLGFLATLSDELTDSSAMCIKISLWSVACTSECRRRRFANLLFAPYEIRASFSTPDTALQRRRFARPALHLRTVTLSANLPSRLSFFPFGGSADRSVPFESFAASASAHACVLPLTSSPSHSSDGSIPVPCQLSGAPPPIFRTLAPLSLAFLASPGPHSRVRWRSQFSVDGLLHADMTLQGTAV
jgi:hypothetical protein